jgi:hypothetical protein
MIDMVQLSREVGVTLAPSTRLLGAKRTRGIDDAVFAKVEMTPADWDQLLARAPFRGSDLTTESRGYLEPDDGWWDPSAARDLRAAQVNLAGGRILNVGVDVASKPGVVVVYLMNHGT